MLNKFTKDGVFLRKKNELFNHIQYNTKETDQIWFLVVKKKTCTVLAKVHCAFVQIPKFSAVTFCILVQEIVTNSAF